MVQCAIILSCLPVQASPGTTISRRLRVAWSSRPFGEHLDGTPLEDPNAGKNPAAVALGRLGGAKGGKARAKALSARRRRMIAKKAAAARWKT